MQHILDDTQLQGKFVTVDGYKMHVIDEGPLDAPTLLCLHGNPTWSYQFRNVVKNLRGTFRVISPDHIGMGLSDKPQSKSFLARERVEHLATLLKELNVKNFSLLMHDWGGPIGARLACELSERVDKLIFLNTTLTEVSSLPAFIRYASGTFFGKLLTQCTTGFLQLLLRVGTSKGLTKKEKENYLFPYKTSRERKAIYDFVADIPLTKHHPSYAAIDELKKRLPLLRMKPTLLLWGLLDPCFHKGILANVSSYFPSAKIITYEDASHLVLEDKAQQCLSEISGFLRSTEAPRM